MEFKQLQSFAAVVKYQSFTKAAEKLFLSQSTVSTHVSTLEEELGKKLIFRTTKSLELTSKGAEVYDYAVKILGLRDRMVDCCTQRPQKIIHLGASTIPSAYILPELLPEFGAKFPETYFSIHQSDSHGVIESLKEGIFDVGLVGMSVEDDKIDCVPFCRDQMVLIAPVNEYFLQMKAHGCGMRELLREPIILREAGGNKKTVDMFLECVGISEDELNVIARINDQEAIKNMVSRGIGISIISGLAAKNFLAERRVLSFPFESDSPGKTIYLVSRRDYILPSHIRSFLKFMLKKSEK